MEIQKKVMMSTALFVLLISLASAFGVSTFYWDGNPLKLHPGETATVNLALQNMVGDEDYTFNAIIRDDGKGIAKLVYEDEKYFVPANTQRLDVPIQVTVPADTQYGEIRWIHVSFVPVTEGDEGMVSIVGATGSKFPVEIVAEKESTFYEEPAITVEVKSTMGSFWIYLIIAILIVIVAIQVVKKKKK